MSFSKTVVFTTFLWVQPTDFRMAPMLISAWLASFSTPPLTISMVLGSKPICPEMYMVRSTITAYKNRVDDYLDCWAYTNKKNRFWWWEFHFSFIILHSKLIDSIFKNQYESVDSFLKKKKSRKPWIFKQKYFLKKLQFLILTQKLNFRVPSFFGREN